MLVGCLRQGVLLFLLEPKQAPPSLPVGLVSAAAVLGKLICCLNAD